MNKYAKHIVDNISQMIDGINSNVTQACRIQVNKFSRQSIVIHYIRREREQLAAIY